MTHHVPGHWQTFADHSGKVWRPDPPKPKSTLYECPYCLGWVETEYHILGPIRAYRGGRDMFPEMQWCTPDGFVTLRFSQSPRPPEE